MNVIVHSDDKMITNHCNTLNFKYMINRICSAKVQHT